MVSLKIINFFFYSLYLHALPQLAFFYADDNLRKPFNDFSNSDIVRSVILLVVVFSCFRLMPILFEMFKDISTRLKVVIMVFSFMISIFTIGFLLAVYFEG
jgi:hypothetical protein